MPTSGSLASEPEAQLVERLGGVHAHPAPSVLQISQVTTEPLVASRAATDCTNAEKIAPGLRERHSGAHRRSGARRHLPREGAWSRCVGRDLTRAGAALGPWRETLPGTLRLEGVPLPLTTELVDEALEVYPAVVRALEERAIAVRSRCEQIARDANIRVRVQHRVKGKTSLERKLRRELDRDEQSPRFSSARHGLDVLRAVRDLIGVRVLPYREQDRAALADRICAAFYGEDGPDTPVERRADDLISPNPDYRAIHCQVGGAHGEVTEVTDVGFCSEIQIAGALAHVYNEIEHDIGYKRSNELDSLSAAEKAALSVLANHLRAGDSLVEGVLSAYELQMAPPEAEPSAAAFRDFYEFVHVMRLHFPSARDFPRNASVLYEALVSVGLDSEASIVEELLHGDYREVAASDLARFNERLEGTDSLRLEEETSDLLLTLLLREKAGDFAATRAPGRPPRVMSLSRRYLEWTGGSPDVGQDRSPAPAVEGRRRSAWELVRDAAAELGDEGAVFGLRDIVRSGQSMDSSRGYHSIAPVVAGMTCNASGVAVPPEVAQLLYRESRGVYRLARPGDCEPSVIIDQMD